MLLTLTRIIFHHLRICTYLANKADCYSDLTCILSDTPPPRLLVFFNTMLFSDGMPVCPFLTSPLLYCNISAWSNQQTNSDPVSVMMNSCVLQLLGSQVSFTPLTLPDETLSLTLVSGVVHTNHSHIAGSLNSSMVSR